MMTAGQLKKSLRTLHWSTLTLADVLHCPTDVVMAWYFGYEPVPPAVASWLERLVAAHEDNPAPSGGLSDQDTGAADAGDH
ncbi:MAG: hypothetical protein KME20_28085 [Kaiparowitsia implicata GSE-PSE-MK54-09C]|jgi:hypothetical protein|nr:hypothetical protein [Kaiparowitsia implicata GSE-PSE-MK54-09C]